MFKSVRSAEMIFIFNISPLCFLKSKYACFVCHREMTLKTKSCIYLPHILTARERLHYFGCLYCCSLAKTQKTIIKQLWIWNLQKMSHLHNSFWKNTNKTVSQPVKWNKSIDHRKLLQKHLSIEILPGLVRRYFYPACRHSRRLIYIISQTARTYKSAHIVNSIHLFFVLLAQLFVNSLPSYPCEHKHTWVRWKQRFRECGVFYWPHN
jgi:hypothetical protein